MKQILLLLALLLSKHAFSFENVNLSFRGTSGIFHSKYLVSYCEDAECKSEIKPLLATKKSEKSSELVFKKVARQIKRDYYINGQDVESFDIDLNPSVNNITELMEEDFTGAGGEAPMHYKDVRKVLGMIKTHEAKISIMGVLSSNKKGTESSEFIVIYIPKLDRVYSLERFLYAD